eukprot:gene22027-30259_t
MKPSSDHTLDFLPVLSAKSLLPHYGPEYFATFANEKATILQNINNFLSQTEEQLSRSTECSRYVFNFDFSEDSYTWSCSRSSLLDLVEFTMDIFFDKNSQRIVIKIHRVNGKSSLFREVVKQFTSFGSNIWYPYDPIKQCEKKSVEKRVSVNSCNFKYHINCSEFISSCKSLSSWAATDPVEALDSLGVALPNLSKLLEEATKNDRNIEEITAMRNQYMSLINVVASVVVYAGELLSCRPISPCKSTTELISPIVLHASQILGKDGQYGCNPPSFSSRCCQSDIMIPEQWAVLQCLPNQCLSRVLLQALGSLLMTFQHPMSMGDTASEHQKWLCSALYERSDFMAVVGSISAHSVPSYSRKNSLSSNNSEDIAAYAHVLDRTLASTLIACH